MRTRRNGVNLLSVLAAVALAGCSNSPTGPATGTMRIRMTDAPSDFDAVNLVVTQVSVHLADANEDSTSGWQVLNSETKTYDLLALRNGVFTTIGEASLSAGHYTQIRLKLGPGSNVVVGGITYPLTVPSGLQTGLKLIGSFDVSAGGILEVGLDFDAARSINQTGVGEYVLKPTVKVMPFSTSGAIRGTALPVGTSVTIFAIQAPDTLGSAVAGSDGGFTVSLLAAGSYALAFHPEVDYRDTTLSGVLVTAGSTTDVGSVQLTAK